MLLWGLAWERQSVGRWQRDLTPTAFPLAVLLEWGHTITFYSTALYDVTAWGVITFDVCGPPPPHLSLEVGGIAGRHVGAIGSVGVAACLSSHLFLGWQRCGQEKQLWHVTAHSEVSALPGCAVAALAVKGPQRREL